MGNPYHSDENLNLIGEIQTRLWNKDWEIGELLSILGYVEEQGKTVNWIPSRKSYQQGLVGRKKLQLDCCPAAVPCENKAMAKEQQKEKAMRMTNTEHTVDINIDANTTTFNADEKKAEYLRYRLQDVEREKLEEARKNFSIYEDSPPVTPKEFVERIKSGAFRYDLNHVTKDGNWNDGKSWRNAPDGIVWRTKDADHDGFNAFRTKVEAAELLVRDMITIGTPAEGLKALQEFEATTFS